MTALFEARERENGTFGVWCTSPQGWAGAPQGSRSPYKFEHPADAQAMALQWAEQCAEIR